MIEQRLEERVPVDRRIEIHTVADVNIEERFNEQAGTTWVVLGINDGCTTLTLAEAAALAACLKQVVRKLRRMQG